MADRPGGHDYHERHPWRRGDGYVRASFKRRCRLFGKARGGKPCLERDSHDSARRLERRGENPKTPSRLSRTVSGRRELRHSPARTVFDGNGPRRQTSGEGQTRQDRAPYRICLSRREGAHDRRASPEMALAGALAAKKLNIKLAHVESGLRSFDLTMPEEVNRIIIDSISDILFTTEERANKNLINEGIKEEKIFFVGNAMIDSLLKHRELADKSDILEKSGLIRKKYCVLTLHRPSNVDNHESFNKMVDIMHEIQKKVKIIFPIHPRTRNNIKSFGLTDAVSKMKNLILVEPLGYLDFLKLISNAMFVLTDSGGIQEETTILNVPCITLRDNTERHVTCEKGTNMLVSTKKEEIVNAVNTILENKFKSNGTPEKWDGNSTKRIVKVILDQIQ